MKITPTELPEVFIIEPTVFNDSRGCFFESYHQARFKEAGLCHDFVQDNISVSMKGVLRGLHFQNPHAQTKLVSVLQGEVFDVAVDIRVDSPTFGRWVSVILSGENKKQLYIPAGFAHGFVSLTDHTIFVYKCSALYNAAAEASIIWNDPTLQITWPINDPVLSNKDATAPKLNDYSWYRLPKI